MDEIINKCLNHKISLYSYFICFCLYNEKSDLLINYCKNVDRINTKDFLWLVDNGYLEELKDRNIINIEDLKLTDKFKNDVLKIVNTNGLTFDECFEQLREVYPSKVTDVSNNGVRRLQGDVERCKRLYSTIIGNSIIDYEFHNLILQCIKFEINERKKSKSLQYMQMLATYLQQKTWSLVQEDVIKEIKKYGSVDCNIDVNKGFSQDV